MKLAEVALTTIDNPFDPFTQFEEWYAFDVNVKGYNTLAYLDRISYDTTEMAPDIANLLREYAINEAVRINPLGLYKKVYKRSQ